MWTTYLEGPKGEAMVRTGIPLAACPVARLINICGRHPCIFMRSALQPQSKWRMCAQKLWLGDGKIQRGDKLQMRDAAKFPRTPNRG